MKRMKKCPGCGAIQKASRTNCIDCGEYLGDAHAAFAAELDEQAKRTVERKMDRDDTSSPLYYIRRAVIILAVTASVAAIVLTAVFKSKYNTLLLYVSVLLCVLSLLCAMFPRLASWVMRSRRYYRSPMTPRECDYIDSGERKLTLVFAVLLLAVGIFTSVYFLREKPPKDNGGPRYETTEDGSLMIIS